ncbi:MAG: hypothetical protein ACYC36_13325 [Bellilinea sp.]
MNEPIECKHSDTEKDVSIFNGLCPLCVLARAEAAERELAALKERNEKVNSIIGEAIKHLETELGEWLGIEPPYNNYPDMNEAHALLLSVYQALPEPPEEE